MSVKVATFNVMNLARPGERFYDDQDPYSEAEYDEKADWTAGQLRLMEADLVAFQEVFHEEALRDVCGRSGSFDGATVVAPGAGGSSGPRLGLATQLSLVEPVSTVTDFPAGVDAAVDGLALPVGRFSRPVLRARVVLDPANGTTLTVFVVHLKSKRPIRDPQTPEHDPREEALGKARALIRRAAEAAALRFLVLDEIVDNARPVIVLGDLNDAARAVSTDIVLGDAPSRFWPKAASDRKAYWDRLLYSTYEINARQVGRDVSYTHISTGGTRTRITSSSARSSTTATRNASQRSATSGTSTTTSSTASSATTVTVVWYPTTDSSLRRSACADDVAASRRQDPRGGLTWRPC